MFSPRQRGRGIGVNDMALGVAALTLPILGGILFQLSGFGAPGVFGLLVALPAIFLTALLREKKPGSYANKSISPMGL